MSELDRFSYDIGYRNGTFDAEHMYRADIETHKEALRHALKQTEKMSEYALKMAAMQTQPLMIVQPPDEKWFSLHMKAAGIPPTVIKETKNVGLSVKQKLDEVNSTVDNLMGQLAQAKKDLAQERGLRQQQQDGHRALYIYQSGRIENRAPMAGPNGVVSRVSFDELQPAEIVPIRDARYWDIQYAPRSNRRDFRLLRTIGKLHVYEEIS